MSDKDEIMQQVAPENDVNASENANVESVENAAAKSVENVQNVANGETADAENVQKTDDNSADNTQKGGENSAANGGKTKKKFKLGTVGKCTLVLVVIAVVAGLLLGQAGRNLPRNQAVARFL